MFLLSYFKVYTKVIRMMKYEVRLDAFEGPLDLLLHLINEAKVDIYDIPMTEITEQYLDYIHTMQELQLDIASEYLVMAATLIAIKSKMLLPKKEPLFDDEIIEEEIDPREDLMNRLLEYRKYKQLAQQLKEREKERAYIYTKPPVPLESFLQEEKRKVAMVQGVTLFDMLGAYKKMLKRLKYQKPLEKTVKTEIYTVQERMEELLYLLKKEKRSRTFFSLFDKLDRSYFVVTFLALLQLMKEGKIICFQEENFAEIYISLK